MSVRKRLLHEKVVGGGKSLVQALRVYAKINDKVYTLIEYKKQKFSLIGGLAESHNDENDLPLMSMLRELSEAILFLAGFIFVPQKYYAECFWRQMDFELGEWEVQFTTKGLNIPGLGSIHHVNGKPLKCKFPGNMLMQNFLPWHINGWMFHVWLYDDFVKEHLQPTQVGLGEFPNALCYHPGNSSSHYVAIPFENGELDMSVLGLSIPHSMWRGKAPEALLARYGKIEPYFFGDTSQPIPKALEPYFVREHDDRYSFYPLRNTWGIIKGLFSL